MADDRHSILIVHGTHKVLERCGGPTAAATERSTTRLGSWYLDMLFWRPQVAIFVNEATLVPVLTRFAPAANLLDRFPAAVAAVLDGHGVADAFVTAEVVEMSERRLAKTASRSVLGVMNEFRFLAEVYTDDAGTDDLLGLSVRLAMTPCGPLYKRHGSPDRELAAIVASSMRAE